MSHSIQKRLFPAVTALLLSCFVFSNTALAVGTLIKNICRVKGQEENVLRGLGLVVGLKGTGEAGDGPTMRALARSLEIMGSPLSSNGQIDAAALKDLKNNKNVALAIITVVVPPTGARRGDKLDCTVSGISGKSLAGGRIAFAALQGPNTKDRRIYGLAQGAIHIENPEAPLAGKIHGGCKMEEDVFTPFHSNGVVTLVIDKNHANFQTATDIVETIRSRYAREGEQLVQAKDAANIIVQIPAVYKDEPVAFVSEILSLQIYEPQPEARVVINERTGSIVISGEVEIGSVVVTHKNLVVETSNPSKFVGVDTTDSNPAKLESLLKALNALKVPPADIIEIIKGIDRNGKLHGRLIIE